MLVGVCGLPLGPFIYGKKIPPLFAQCSHMHDKVHQLLKQYDFFGGFSALIVGWVFLHILPKYCMLRLLRAGVGSWDIMEISRVTSEDLHRYKNRYKSAPCNIWRGVTHQVSFTAESLFWRPVNFIFKYHLLWFTFGLLFFVYCCSVLGVLNSVSTVPKSLGSALLIWVIFFQHFHFC